MTPLSYINAINAGKYFMPELYRDMATKPLLLKLAYEMVHNPEWQLMRGPVRTPSAGLRHDQPVAAGANRSSHRYQPVVAALLSVALKSMPLGSYVRCCSAFARVLLHVIDWYGSYVCVTIIHDLS